MSEPECREPECRACDGAGEVDEGDPWGRDPGIEHLVPCPACCAEDYERSLRAEEEELDRYWADQDRYAFERDHAPGRV